MLVLIANSLNVGCKALQGTGEGFRGDGKLLKDL